MSLCAVPLSPPPGKARRVKCDGAKPACSSCVKSAKFKHEAVQCVYRADLYVQKCREDDLLRRTSTGAVKPEDSDDGCCPPELAAEMSSSSGSLEAMQSEEPRSHRTDCGPHSSLALRTRKQGGHADVSLFAVVSAPTVLPAILPPLPPLPPLPVLHTLACRTRENVPMSLDESILATSSSSSSGSFRVARDDGAPFSARTRPSRASSQSGLTTNPPSPAITHTETDLSSWPSPRSPLDEWCSNLVTTYPPVPYPPASSFEGINPAWMEALTAGMIPPLSLSDTLETLGLDGGQRGCATDDYDMTGLDLPSVASAALRPAPAPTSMPALKSEASFGMETLALPMETPWPCGGGAPLGYERFA